MRLACPNCDARYEVPDDAIPEGGRDVQCSSCGHAWFQLRPEDEVAAEEEALLYGDDLPDPVAPAAAPPPAPAPAPAPAAAFAEAPEPDDPPAPDPAAPSRGMDDAVLAVLREEAARETEARRLEAQRAENRKADAEGQMQTQPALGVEDTPTPEAMTATQRRLAMLRGEDPDAAPAETLAARTPARRDLLPSVEELTSTLQPGESGAEADAAVDALPDLTRGNGFRNGFLAVMVLLIILVGLYIAAPQLATAIPALAEPLTSYMGAVDGLRLWLDGMMNSATNALNGG